PEPNVAVGAVDSVSLPAPTGNGSDVPICAVQGELTDGIVVMVDNEQVAVCIGKNSFGMIEPSISVDTVVCGDAARARRGNTRDGGHKPVIADRRHFPNRVGRGVGDKKTALLVHSNA